MTWYLRYSREKEKEKEENEFRFVARARNTEKWRKKLIACRLINLIFETTRYSEAILVVSITRSGSREIYRFSPGRRNNLKLAIVTIRREYEETSGCSRKKEREKIEGSPVVAARRDKQKNRSAAGNIRVK